MKMKQLTALVLAGMMILPAAAVTADDSAVEAIKAKGKVGKKANKPPKEALEEANGRNGKEENK